MIAKPFRGKSAVLLTVAIALSACGQQSSSVPGAASAPTQARKDALKNALKNAPSATEVGKWFVELSGDPMSLGTQSLNAQSLSSQQASFRAQAAAQGIRYQEVASFHTLFNGFSVEASELEIQRLSRLPGVINVSPVHQVSVPPKSSVIDQGDTPQLVSAIGMTGADYAQNELGLTGKGVKVGIIDTGLDLTHPAFTGRVATSKDFVGDAYDADSPDPAINTPKPGPSVQDCNGHGTHVAGIVGGNDPSRNIKGVAPETSFGIYRVFGCKGSVNDDVVLAAMEQAYKDGMQVVNMSLGSDYDGWSQSVESRAASRMVKAGIVMSIAAGNAGSTGQYSVGSPAGGENVIAVASVDNVQIELKSFAASNNPSVPLGYNVPTGSPEAVSGTTLPLTKLATSTSTTTNDGCTTAAGTNPYAPGSLSGQAVLIRRGTCTFRSKVLNAQAAGASAVLLYNNTSGYVNATLTSATDPAPINIPVLGLQQSDGNALSAALSAGPVSVTFNAGTQRFSNITGNTLSGFSAYGMSPELELKPDVAAPGGAIRSAWPLSLIASGTNTIGGTSMAAPHLAGVAALMLQLKPGIEAKNMRTLLMNTANPRSYLNGATLTPFNDYVQQQGAGMVNVLNAAAALVSGVSATPSKLSLGESQTFGARSKVLVLHNDGLVAQKFTVTHVPALTLAGTVQAPKADPSAASVSVNGTNVDGGVTTTVTVPAGGSTELNVVVTPPAGAPAKSQYGGYVVMNSPLGASLRVPYAGFNGDYQSIEVLGDVSIGGSVYDFPLFEDAKTQTDYEASENPTGLSFSFATVKNPDGKDVLDAPSVLINFAIQSRRLTQDVLDASGNVVATLKTENYLSRNATNVLTTGSDTFNVYGWNGKLIDGTNAPNGKYQLRYRVLKALGDENNAADTETYTTPVFAVTRP